MVCYQGYRGISQEDMDKAKYRRVGAKFPCPLVNTTVLRHVQHPRSSPNLVVCFYRAWSHVHIFLSLVPSWQRNVDRVEISKSIILWSLRYLVIVNCQQNFHKDLGVCVHDFMYGHIYMRVCVWIFLYMHVTRHWHSCIPPFFFERERDRVSHWSRCF